MLSSTWRSLSRLGEDLEIRASVTLKGRSALVTNLPLRGVYLREPQDIVAPVDAEVYLRPVFPESEAISTRVLSSRDPSQVQLGQGAV